MKYRVMSTIAPACTVERGQYSKFEDAYRAYQLEDSKYNLSFNYIEKKAKGGWTRLTDIEIARKNVKKVEYKKIKITTSTENYTFTLPRPVKVPNNMDQANAALYITLDLLGVKPTVKRKTVRK